MRYRVEFNAYAARAFRKLSLDVQKRIRPHIDRLAGQPRPMGVEKLSGMDDTYRIRVGDYRVIYEIHDDTILVLVVDVAHRREVYRD